MCTTECNSRRDQMVNGLPQSESLQANHLIARRELLILIVLVV